MVLYAGDSAGYGGRGGGTIWLEVTDLELNGGLHAKGAPGAVSPNSASAGAGLSNLSAPVHCRWGQLFPFFHSSAESLSSFCPSSCPAWHT
jgi:hypothetical protein